MLTMKANYALDASAVLALINTEPGHEKVAHYLPEACISTVNLSEVASILHGMTVPDNEVALLLDSLVPTVVAFDKINAYQTAWFKFATKNMGLSLGDRACIALGKIYDIPVVTADKMWAKLDIGIKIVLIR